MALALRGGPSTCSVEAMLQDCSPLRELAEHVVRILHQQRQL